MSEAFIGSIMLFAGTFAPRNYALCNGQTMSINQNAALFSIIGTYYGGNGSTTFQLPNLQGRSPVHVGSGAGLSPVQLGQMSGSNSTTLLTAQLPAHVHPFALAVSSAPADQSSPVGGVLAVPANTPAGRTPPTPTFAFTQSVATGAGATQNTGAAGGSQPLPINPPILGLNFCICIAGLYPSRN